MPLILVEVEMAHVIQSKPYIFSVVDRENLKKFFFSEECKSRDGVAASSCAEGFGVCCVSE